MNPHSYDLAQPTKWTKEDPAYIEGEGHSNKRPCSHNLVKESNIKG